MQIECDFSCFPSLVSEIERMYECCKNDGGEWEHNLAKYLTGQMTKLLEICKSS